MAQPTRSSHALPSEVLAVRRSTLNSLHGHDGVADADAELLRGVLLVRRADVDEHLLRSG